MTLRNTHSALLCVFKGVTTICGRLFLPQDKKLNKVLFISQVGLNDRSARYKIRVVRSSIHIYLKHEKKHESTSEAILFQLKIDVNTHSSLSTGDGGWRIQRHDWSDRLSIKLPANQFWLSISQLSGSYLGLLTIFLDITILSKSEVSLCISHTLTLFLDFAILSFFKIKVIIKVRNCEISTSLIFVIRWQKWAFITNRSKLNCVLDHRFVVCC